MLNLIGLVYLLKNILINFNGFNSLIADLKTNNHNSPVILFDTKGIDSQKRLRQEIRRTLHEKELSSYSRKIFIDFGANDGSSIRYVLDKPAVTTGEVLVIVISILVPD